MARINYRAQIVDLLKAHGPMTGADLADHLGLDTRKVGNIISFARWQCPGELLRIVRYQPVTGKRQRDMAVFASEPGEDVPRTPYTARKQRRRRAQAKARYLDKNRAAVNTRASAKKAERTGQPMAINPWLQLAAPETRPTMARLAGMGAP